MSAKKKSTQALLRATTSLPMGYDGVLRELMSLIESARRAAARSVNAVMTATYFLVGRAVVEEEQRGAKRAAYGEELLARLGADLTKRFGRGVLPRQPRDDATLLSRVRVRGPKIRAAV